MRPLPSPTAAVAALALLVLAGCARPPGPAARSPAAGALPGSAPLDVHPFSGTAAGVGTCDNALVPLAQDTYANLGIPENAIAALVEVAYRAAGAAGDELQVAVYRDGAQVGGGTGITSKQGPSPVRVTLAKADWRDAAGLQVIVYVCGGPAQQPFEGAGSFFAGPVPANYTALPPA